MWLIPCYVVANGNCRCRTKFGENVLRYRWLLSALIRGSGRVIMWNLLRKHMKTNWLHLRSRLWLLNRIQGYATWQEKPNSSRDSSSLHVRSSSRHCYALTLIYTFCEPNVKLAAEWTLQWCVYTALTDISCWPEESSTVRWYVGYETGRTTQTNLHIQTH